MGIKETGLYLVVLKKIEFWITLEKVICAVTCLSCSSGFGLSGSSGLSGAGLVARIILMAKMWLL